MTDPNPPQLPADVFPPDPETLVGQIRYTVGDIHYDSVTERYERFTDMEIQVALVQAENNVARAIALLYLKLATQAAEKAKSVKDYDLQIDLTKRATELRQIYLLWLGRAEAEDDVDIFEAFQTGSTYTLNDPRKAELTVSPYRFPNSPYGRYAN